MDSKSRRTLALGRRLKSTGSDPGARIDVVARVQLTFEPTGVSPRRQNTVGIIEDNASTAGTADHAARIKVPTTAKTRRCDISIVGQWQCLYNDDGNDRIVAVSGLAAGVRQLYSAMILTVCCFTLHIVYSPGTWRAANPCKFNRPGTAYHSREWLSYKEPQHSTLPHCQSSTKRLIMHRVEALEIVWQLQGEVGRVPWSKYSCD
jgi:hypothetical protein